MNKKVSIAIDGPAAAGKSTVAKVIAKNLDYVYIDTGAMYRALTYAVLENNEDPKNEEAVFSILQNNSIRLVQVEGTQHVLLNDIDVSDVIRSPEVTNNVSFVAIHPTVREAMVKQQQELAKNGGVVMDGRDICSYVLPFAEVKIFLIASVAERAERRHRENVEKGFASDLEVLKAEIAKRDEIDSTREIAPLKKAPDAIEIDTTSKSIEQVIDAILSVYNEKTQNINN